MIEAIELEDIKLFCDFYKLEYKSHSFVDYQGICDGRVFIICMFQGVEIEVVTNNVELINLKNETK
jgi:hypothetical protein